MLFDCPSKSYIQWMDCDYLGPISPLVVLGAEFYSGLIRVDEFR
jgi:hypothetical protein